MNYQAYPQMDNQRPSLDKQRTMLIGGAALLGVGVLIILAFVAYIVYNVIQNQQIQAKYLSSKIQTTGLSQEGRLNVNQGGLGVNQGVSDNLTVYSISGQQPSVKPDNLANNIEVTHITPDLIYST